MCALSQLLLTPRGKRRARAVKLLLDAMLSPDIADIRGLTFVVGDELIDLVAVGAAVRPT